MKKIMGLTLILLVGLNGLTQNVKDDFNKMRTSLDDKEQYCIDITYQLYEDESMNKEIDQAENKLIKNGSTIFSKLLDIESIMTDQYLFRIDHQQKYILIDEMKPSYETEQFITEYSDSLWAIIGDLVTVTENQKNIEYHVAQPYGEYERIIYIRSKNDYKIKGIRYYYRESREWSGQSSKPLLEMTLNYQKSCDYPRYTSTMYTQYVSKDAGTFNLKEAYKNYELINLLEQ